MNNLDTFPTDDKLIEIERNIEKIEDRNHRLLKQVLWMEWREKHGLPRNTSSSSAEIDSQKNDSTLEGAESNEQNNNQNPVSEVSVQTKDDNDTNDHQVIHKKDGRPVSYTHLTLPTNREV